MLCNDCIRSIRLELVRVPIAELAAAEPLLAIDELLAATASLAK